MGGPLWEGQGWERVWGSGAGWATAARGMGDAREVPLRCKMRLRRDPDFDIRSCRASFGEPVWGGVVAEVGRKWAKGQIKGKGGVGAHSGSLWVPSSAPIPGGRVMAGTQQVLPRERWGHLRTSRYFL